MGETTDNVNQAGNSVYTPEFVTLAHELGHALSILAGSATMTCEDIFRLFVPDAGTFEQPGEGRNRWTSAEELTAITAVENQVRQELGLQLRGGHYAVLDPELEERVQSRKSLVRDTQLFIFRLESHRATPEKAKGKLESIRKVVTDMGTEPIKGLSNTQRRRRCTEYENTIKTALKDAAALGKAVQVAGGEVLEGESAPYAQLLAREMPGALPRGFQ
jgi:hypothetical protein